MIALEHFIWSNVDKFGYFVNNICLDKNKTIKLNTKVIYSITFIDSLILSLQ